MRPKVVIAVFGFALVLLGLIVLIKGVAVRNSASEAPDAVVAVTNTSSLVAAGRPVTVGHAPGGSPAAAGAEMANPEPYVSPELREEVIRRQITEIRDLRRSVDGSNNPIIISALLGHMHDSEPQVRQAALWAIRELDDRNTIPGLKEAADTTPDPREKVAILEAIDFLNLPPATPRSGFGSPPPPPPPDSAPQ